MANTWCRLYAEFATDPKIQMMNECMQRRYIMLLCMRTSNVTVTLHETEIAFHMRISDADLAETKALFIAKGFIDEDWNLKNWDKRQFTSDSSAARVARHREKKKKASNGDVTLHVTNANALDTDTDTDTDTEENINTEQKIKAEENLNEDILFFLPPEKETPKPAKQKKQKSEEITFNQFIEKCLSDNLEPIPANHAVIRWAETSRIPENFIIVAWEAFKAKHVNDNKKRQADWPATFYNYCKLDYLKVWAFDREGTPYLTTAGKNFEKGLICER